MTKTLVFDTGPIITLTTNNLLWILEPLKKKFNGEFCIPSSVKKELIDKPLLSKRFKFEALYVINFIKKGIIKEYNENLIAKTNLLLNTANQIFITKGNPMKIVQKAEMEALALTSELKASATVIDERTTRLLIENPKKLAKLLSKKLKTKIIINMKALREFQKILGNIKIIRSVDLIIYAYEQKLLDKFIQNNNKKDLLDALLWGAKTRGCSIAIAEIQKVMKFEGFY